jgi:hypothetical protein
MADTLQQDNEDEKEEEDEEDANALPRHVSRRQANLNPVRFDPDMNRHPAFVGSGNPQQQMPKTQEVGSDFPDFMFESQSSLDSQSKRAFAVSFAGR